MTHTITYEKKLNTAQKCPHCKAQMKIHSHSLSKGLVESFVKLALRARNKEINAVHLNDELNLDKVAYNNFNKLKYWGIVKMYEKGSGRWQLTEKGIEFLNNRLALPLSVHTFRNSVVDRDRNVAVISDIVTGYSREYWQTEFSFRIVHSRIVPVKELGVQEKLFEEPNIKI
jgi:predicted transcriptional regulator